MANLKNLKPIKKGDLSNEEAKKRGRKGGKKSAESRRKKRLLKELMTEFGAMELPAGTLRQSMAEMGVVDETITNDMALVIGQYQAAIKGNPTAATFIRDTKGEKPVEKREDNINIDGELKTVTIKVQDFTMPEKPKKTPARAKKEAK